MTYFFAVIHYDPTLWPTLKGAVEYDESLTIFFPPPRDETPEHAVISCREVTATSFGMIRLTPDWPKEIRGLAIEHLHVHPHRVAWIGENETSRPIGFAQLPSN
ncbi:hypothetical protein ACR42A_32150 [Burkholderia gladioli]|uniref:hypothetical protein n=1 Tax=Burkholderia gladioli TaxID=28095 RepID=UPI003DA696E9